MFKVFEMTDYYYYYCHYYYYYHLILFQIFFFFQWFYYKNGRETNDDTYELRSNFKEKKTNENTNVTEILSLESVVQTILYSSLPMHPFLGNCEMAVAPVQKKKKELQGFFFFFYYYFYFLKWNNGITRLFK